MNQNSCLKSKLQSRQVDNNMNGSKHSKEYGMTASVCDKANIALLELGSNL